MKTVKQLNKKIEHSLNNARDLIRQFGKHDKGANKSINKIRESIEFDKQIVAYLDTKPNEAYLKSSRDKIRKQLKTADDLIYAQDESRKDYRLVVKNIKDEHNYSKLKKQLEKLDYILD